jgi:hypothetical protein
VSWLASLGSAWIVAVWRHSVIVCDSVDHSPSSADAWNALTKSATNAAAQVAPAEHGERTLGQSGHDLAC